MGKVTWRKARPGEMFFGGRGVIIPRPLPSAPPEPTQKPSTEKTQLKPPNPGSAD
jgi:hypothetical protein